MMRNQKWHINWFDDEEDAMMLSNKEHVIKILEDMMYAYCQHTSYNVPTGSYNASNITLSDGTKCKSIKIKISENTAINFGTKTEQGAYIYDLPYMQPFNSSNNIFKIVKSPYQAMIGGASTQEVLYMSVEVDQESQEALYKFFNSCQTKKSASTLIADLSNAFKLNKCQAADMLNSLPDFAYAKIPMYISFELIKCKANELRIDDDDEKIIIRLLQGAQISSSKCDSLINLFEKDNSGLLRKLHKGIDGASLFSFYKELNNVFYTAKGKSTIEVQKQSLQIKKVEDWRVLAKEQNIFLWQSDRAFKRMMNIFNSKSRAFKYEAMDLNDNNQLSFTVALVIPQIPFLDLSQDIKNLNAFTLIRIDELATSESLNALKSNVDNQGRSFYLPAFNLCLLENEQWKGDITDAVNIAFAVSPVASGMVFQGGKLLLIGGSEILLATSMLAIDGYRSELEKTPKGKDVLKAYDAFMVLFVVYQGGKIVVGLPEALAKLKSSWKAFNNTIEAIDNEIAAFEREVAVGVASGRIVKEGAQTFKVGNPFAGIPIERIKYGTSGKIFIIGTDMEKRIEPFAEVLKKQGYEIELFSAKYQTKPITIEGKSYSWEQIQADWNKMIEAKYKGKTWIPYDDVNALKNTQNTLMYKANQQFIQRALQEGTIIDIGKTYDSHFYDMEILNVFK
jgi:hypothetical protein